MKETGIYVLLLGAVFFSACTHKPAKTLTPTTLHSCPPEYINPLAGPDEPPNPAIPDPLTTVWIKI